MRVLVTGDGDSGSWKVRGEQLGGAIGATVIPDASHEDMQRHDLVVVVKRVHNPYNLQRCDRPIVWDAVDWFPQPCAWERGELIGRTHDYAGRMGADAIIAATRHMADDLGIPYFLPHHGWDRGRAEIRPEIKRIGYEGMAKYVDGWRLALVRGCNERGWNFFINPKDYLSMDVIIAARSGQWDTYANRHWKSGVKLANAQIAGLPFIGNRESGCEDIANGSVLWAETPEEFFTHADDLRVQGLRSWIGGEMHSAAPRLPDVAKQYRDMLETIYGRTRS